MPVNITKIKYMGVDFKARTAVTTAVAFLKNKKIHVSSVKKKEELYDYLLQLPVICSFPFFQNPVNWHETDAVLAWLGGRRYLAGQAVQSVNPEEGNNGTPACTAFGRQLIGARG